MQRHIAAIALVIPDYDEAIRFFTEAMGFVLQEDDDRGGGKRWVRVAPRADSDFALLLAKAVTDEQRAAIGHQSGGRVFLFLHTDDFQRDYDRLAAWGVRFTEAPRHEEYGTVVVFLDPWGNKWDLIQPM